MKREFLVAVCLALPLFAGGCATTRPTFGPEQIIPVEIRQTSPATVSKAQAVRQDGSVLVSGRLKLPHGVALPGHVDVLFLRPDGSPLYEHQVQLAGLNSQRGGVQEISFTAAVDLELPAGASAAFSYHAPPF